MFSRTPSGIRNTDLFYRDQYVVIVEGEDDIPFWGIFFPKELSGYKCKIKPVGGSEIKKYVNEINQKPHFAIAIDSDYRLFMNQIHNHVQIIETYVHSIENIMIFPEALLDIITTRSRTETYDIQKIVDWIQRFDEIMHDLMLVDYLIQKECTGQECLGQSCFQFLKNQNTKKPDFDPEKIDSFIKKLNISKETLKLAKSQLKTYKPSQHIRGHFYYGALLCFVNHEINSLRNEKKKISIANDDFYTMLILACKNLLSSSSELQKIKNQAHNVAEEVVKLLSKS
ncbi:MAG: DUF4435 domain-containing protein [Patescibacteria group bacterium]